MKEKTRKNYIEVCITSPLRLCLCIRKKDWSVPVCNFLQQYVLFSVS